MKLVIGEIVELYTEDNTPMAIISVGGVLQRIPMMLLPDAHLGDIVLVESGVAISRLEKEKVGVN